MKNEEKVSNPLTPEFRLWLYRWKRRWQHLRHTRSLVLSDREQKAITRRHHLVDPSGSLPSWSLEEYQGAGNVTYRIGDRYILQIPRLDQADSAAKGAWVSQLVHSSGVSTAQLAAVGVTSSGISHPYYIYERISGVNLHKYLEMPESDLRSLPEIGHRIGEQVAKLHATPIDTVGSEISTKVPRLAMPTRCEVERQLADLTFLRRYHKDLVSSVISNLTEVDVADEVLLHGDLGVRNVLINHGRFNGVIDWGGAAIGEPALEFVAMRPRIAAYALDGYLKGVDDGAFRARVFAGHLARLVREMRFRATKGGRGSTGSLERRLVELVFSEAFSPVI